MRHRKKNIHTRKASTRQGAVSANLVRSLVQHGKIQTTEARAKRLRPVTERLVTLAKNDSLANRRRMRRTVQSEQLIKKLFTDIGPKYKERPGGYVRIIREASRSGDNARMVTIEFV